MNKLDKYKGDRWFHHTATDEVLEALVGQTLRSAEKRDDERWGDILALTTQDGYLVELYHEQDCCESVDIEDIAGDLDDLVGAQLVLCEESTSWKTDPAPEHPDNSWTWSFYKFATNKGHVTVRWLGESNGYYSETVNVRVTHLDAQGGE